jgi:hypothetical protein
MLGGDWTSIFGGLQQLRAKVDGTVGDANPLDAIEDALSRRSRCPSRPGGSRLGFRLSTFASCGYVQLEQRRNRRVEPTKGVVVHDRTHQTSVFGQRPGLRLDGLSCQDAADRCQERVAVQEVHIARELLDGFEAGNPLDLYSPVPSVCQTVFCSIDLPATFDLDRDVRPGSVPTEQVDRANGSGMLPPYQGQTRRQCLGMLGKKCLEMRFHAILLQAWIDAEFIT